MPLVNFYNLVTTKNKYANPGFKVHGINVPARMLLCGSSGAGKTNFALNILKIMKNTFSQLIVCCKSKHEPLYQMLEQKLGDNVTFYEDGQIPDINEFSQSKSPDCVRDQEQTMIIFDDLVNADKKVQQKICEFFLRGRKLGITSLYLSQSYFKTPKFIRINCNYILLRGISSKRDLRMILGEYDMNVDLKQLEAIYKCATMEQFAFLMIDIDGPENMRFRCNFTPLVYPFDL